MLLIAYSYEHTLLVNELIGTMRKTIYNNNKDHNENIFFC